MPKSANQKLKLLYIKEYLERCSDEEHIVSTAELISYLEANGISAERKSIYNDIATLIDYGVDIIPVKGKQSGYYIASREFEISELKLFADAIVSAKFLSEKKADELVKKLASFCSKYDAVHLRRSVFLLNRTSEQNEKVFYNVDALHKAISEKRNISFIYNEWKLDYSAKGSVKMLPRRNGERYQISPRTMMWDDEKYYLIGYEDDELKSFRVDKMEKIELSEECNCNLPEEFNVEAYRKKTFNMFNGAEQRVTLRFDNSLIGIVVDRFGKNLMISKYDEKSFKVTVRANISPQFYAFLFAYADKVCILSPEWVAAEYADMAARVTTQYESNNLK